MLCLESKRKSLGDLKAVTSQLKRAHLCVGIGEIRSVNKPERGGVRSE